MRFGIYMRSVRSGRGAEKVAIHVAMGLAARGHRVDLLLEERGGHLTELAQDAGVAIRDLRAEPRAPARERALQIAALAGVLSSPAGWRNAGFRGLRPLVQLALGDDPPVAALLRYVRRERPDAVLAFLNYPNFALLLASRLAPRETRWLVSVRNHVSTSSANARSRWNRSIPDLMRRCFHFADRVVAPSQGVADDIVDITGLPRERVRVIHNPVSSDVPLLAKAPVAHPFFEEAGVPVLVAAGKLKPQKDFETLLRAFRIARDARPMRLIILGEGDPTALRALAVELGVAADVDWPGHVENPYAWFRRASVYVLSSAWEGFPNVLVEALACGCPVVSTDCPSGPAEILDGGRHGKLVPVGAAGDLAKAILETLETPPPVEHQLARSREFSMERAIDAYEELLTKS
jgi:glycosyltransferase involved in cell wall biosynthesis